MTVFKIGDTGSSCPCGKHVACVEGCALMNYPGYVVDWDDPIAASRAAYATAPYSPSLPDVTRDGGDYLPGSPWPTAQTPEPQPMKDVREHQDAHTYLDSILEQRGNRYGSFVHNSSIAQQLKLTFRRHPFAQWDGLAEDQQEALDQIAAKISRLLVGDPTYVDNWDDIAGYAKLVAERLRAAQ